jgi:hypothetical protein
VLYKLSKIAERNNCTIIVLRHLNKSGGGKAIYLGNMSIGHAPPPPGSSRWSDDWPAKSMPCAQRPASTGLVPVERRLAG